MQCARALTLTRVARMVADSEPEVAEALIAAADDLDPDRADLGQGKRVSAADAKAALARLVDQGRTDLARRLFAAIVESQRVARIGRR